MCDDDGSGCCRLRGAAQQAQRALQCQPLLTMMKLLSVTGLLALIVTNFTLVHPYLVADNRYVNHMHLLYMVASLMLCWTAKSAASVP